MCDKEILYVIRRNDRYVLFVAFSRYLYRSHVETVSSPCDAMRFSFEQGSSLIALLSLYSSDCFVLVPWDYYEWGIV